MTYRQVSGVIIETSGGLKPIYKEYPDATKVSIGNTMIHVISSEKRIAGFPKDNLLYWEDMGRNP